MELERLIAEFNAQTGIEKTASADGVWRYSADGRVFGVTADEQGERLFLFGDIPPPGEDREDAFRKTVLEANYFFRGTGGATLALNPDTGAYALVQSAALAGMTPEGFFTLVESFVNALAVWSAISAGTREAPPAQSENAAPQSSPPAEGRFEFLQV